MTYCDKEKMQRELIRRMSEPEPVRTLRLQKERIEHEREMAARSAFASIEAEALRHEIRGLGAIPEA